MAKLLQAEPGRSSRISNVVRTWWALRSQKRRRERSATGTPAAPVIVTHNAGGEHRRAALLFDVVLSFTFEQGRFPDGTFEVYWARESTGWVENYLGAVSSSAAEFPAGEGV